MGNSYRVGLTGGIGSGKSAVTGLFSELGVPVIDADEVSRNLVKPGQPALVHIIREFGPDITDESGNLRRDKLREIVFADDAARHRLESILHPLIFREIEDFAKRHHETYCILSIPLLLETGNRYKTDRILVVETPESLQIQRVCRRDGVSPQQVENIIQHQISREARLSAADDVIVNDGDLQQLAAKVNELHLQYLDAAEKHKRAQSR